MASDVLRIDVSQPEPAGAGQAVGIASAAELQGDSELTSAVEKGLNRVGLNSSFFKQMMAFFIAQKAASGIGKAAARRMRDPQARVNAMRERMFAKKFGGMEFSGQERTVAESFFQPQVDNAGIMRIRRDRMAGVNRLRGNKGAMFARRVGKSGAGRLAGRAGRLAGIGTGRTALATAGAGLAAIGVAVVAAIASIGQIISNLLKDVSPGIAAARARTEVTGFRTKLAAGRALGPLGETWESIKRILLKLLRATLQILGPALRLIGTILQGIFWIIEKIADILGAVSDFFEWASNGFGLFDDNSGVSKTQGSQRFGGSGGTSVTSNPVVQLQSPTGQMASAFEAMQDTNKQTARKTLTAMKLRVAEFVMKMDITRAEKLEYYPSKLEFS